MSREKRSRNVSPSAVLGLSNLVGLAKHQFLRSRRNDHDSRLVGEYDVSGIHLDRTKHDRLIDRLSLEVPFARDRRHPAHEGWEAGAPDFRPVAGGSVDNGAGHSVLLAGIAVELAPGGRIQ